MDLQELEKKLEAHAKRMKCTIAPSFSIKDIEDLGKQYEESEVLSMTLEKTTKKSMKTIVLAAALVCAMSTAAFAAYQYLTAGEVAGQLGDKKLAAELSGSSFAPQTMTDGDYRATVLGVVSGENISDFQPDTWEVAPGNTYAVVAVEKTDGTAMTWDDEILVTPLIQGQTPWQYNIFTMHSGSAQMQIVDGVLYRIVEFDDMQCFADRQVYLAVLGEPFINNASYAMDETTGIITPKADYAGCNILFTLPLDPAKADPARAEQILKAIDEELAGEDNQEDGDLDDNDQTDYQINFERDTDVRGAVEIQTGDRFVVDENADPNEGITVRQKDYLK